MIRFNATVCRNLEVAQHREWLETNGLGGYASSTIVGLNTRRYHGLLVAATKAPVSRMVLLAKMEETLVIDGRRHDLSANRYPDVIHPEGYMYLKEFRRDPVPVFVYDVEGLPIEKSVCMVEGENTTIIRYDLGVERQGCTLELRPLIAFRDYHALTHENGALDPHVRIDGNLASVAPYRDLPTLYLTHSGGDVQPAGYWYSNLEYDAERERGLDFREDLFNPCVLVFDLSRARDVTVTASTERQSTTATALSRGDDGSPFEILTRAARQFIVRRGVQRSVIAGYHWFADWGRDTMISLPGLTLSTGRFEEARSILLAWAAHVDQGMLPNRFPDAGEQPEYNSVDATLWFFEAVRTLLVHTGDYDFVRANLYDTLAGIIRWHERGTRYRIHADSDGLLYAGEPGVQLTWMDAKIGDYVVTPRQGKPVEVEALWYNALRIMEDLARRYDRADASKHYGEMADRSRDSFPAMFWNAAAGCLYDVADGDRRDAAIRPNQIFAVSLFHTMLPPEKAKAVVDTVERHLLTPYGLRTLAPGDPQYRGRYEGDVASRDAAYHQGTVWPWLLGPFVSAYRAVNGRAPTVLGELLRYAADEGVGQVAEIFDGDPPHRPRGCIAQAWSIAELLRVEALDRVVE